MSIKSKLKKNKELIVDALKLDLKLDVTAKTSKKNSRRGSASSNPNSKRQNTSKFVNSRK